MKITKVDKEVLARVPEGWFVPRDLPYIFRCPEYRCLRLKELGLLESRVIGDDITKLETQYRHCEGVKK